MSNKCILKLYVAGDTATSSRAIAQVKLIVGEDLKDACQLTIIDVKKNPELAEADRILGTPTLCRASPLPAKRIVGDFGDKNKVLTALELA
jgi:circadian clock protein KaiB